MTTYEEAGVNISEADSAKEEMKKSLDNRDKRVLNGLGAFASLAEGTFEGISDPVLVLKTEEPGTKQLLAFQNEKVRSICEDTINHLINDIIVMGATPLYVQDAVICGKLEKEVVTELVAGFADACEAQDCVLVGGETSEQPGVIDPGTYILTASIVGVVDRSKIINGEKIRKGDTVLALASNGLHTNGYTLARKLMNDNPDFAGSNIAGETFLEAIMKPHTCYYQALKGLFGHEGVHGLAHITGGGMGGNLNRILPENMNAVIDASKIEIPPVFTAIKNEGNVEDAEMLKAYNCGVGVNLVAAPEMVNEIIDHLESAGVHTYAIGEIVEGSGEVEYVGEMKW